MNVTMEKGIIYLNITDKGDYAIDLNNKTVKKGNRNLKLTNTIAMFAYRLSNHYYNSLTRFIDKPYEDILTDDDFQTTRLLAYVFRDLSYADSSVERALRNASSYERSIKMGMILPIQNLPQKLSSAKQKEINEYFLNQSSERFADNSYRTYSYDQVMNGIEIFKLEKQYPEISYFQVFIRFADENGIDKHKVLKDANDYYKNIRVNYSSYFHERFGRMLSNMLMDMLVVKYNMNESVNFLSHNLFGEYNRVYTIHETRKDELVDKKIQKNRKTFLEHETKNFTFITPKTVDEIRDEGNQQRNCLASYIERIAEGRTNVVFMRRKEIPEKSYVTIEINQWGELVQARAKHNQSIQDEGALLEYRQYKEYVKKVWE